MTCDVLASGSSGNCLILNNSIAFDVGVSYKTIAPHVKTMKLVLVSHAHGDHFNAATIRRIVSERPTVRFAGGEWLAGMFTLAGVSMRCVDVLEAGKRYDYGAFQIEPFELYHDVPNFGFKIYMGGERALYAVDTGYIDHVGAADFNLYLLEANHADAEIQARIAEKQTRGEFAYEARAAQNHLSQEQALDWLARNAGPNSKYVFLHQHKEAHDG